jgi:co-chaperonin GroES (HSP10)
MIDPHRTPSDSPKTWVMPQGNYILLRVAKSPQHRQTTGGLYVPDRVEDQTIGRGTLVRENHARVEFEGIRFHDDARVLFKREDGIAFEENGESLVLIKASKILAVIEPEGSPP